jgi:hypothetical protein
MHPEGVAKSMAWFTSAFNLSSAASTDISLQREEQPQETMHCSILLSPQQNYFKISIKNVITASNWNNTMDGKRKMKKMG